MFLDPSVLRCGYCNKDPQSMDVTVQWMRVDLNTKRSYKRQGHATLKHFVGFLVQWWKAEITVA